MEQKICPYCNYDNRLRNYYCTQCGCKLESEGQKKSRLSLLTGEPEGAVFLLSKARNSIGRDSGNIIVFSDEQISNKHAIITYEDESFWIEDRQSKNGVFVNGEKISRMERLDDGSVIKLGSTVLRIDYDNPPK